MNVHQQNLRTDARIGPSEGGAATGEPSAAAGEARPGKRRRRGWIVLLLVIAGGGAYYWYTQNPPPAETAAPAPAAPAGPVTIALSPIEVTEIQPQRLQSVVRVTGTLNPIRQTTLTSQVSGTLEDVTAKEGESVAASALLVQIDTADLRSRVEQQRSALQAAEAQLALARTTLSNTQTLVQRNVAARSQLDQAQNAVTSAESQVAASRSALQAAETALANAAVKAPFAGVISERFAAPGEAVAPGTRLLTLVDLSSLEVQVSVPTSVIGQVGVGQSTGLTVEGLDGAFTATVDRISPVALPGTRAIPVFLTLDNPDGLLRGGMFAIGSITLEEKEQAIAVPATAVREDNEGRYVLKIADGMLVRQGIDAVRSWDNGSLVEVAGGVRAGDVIISAPLPSLHAGTPVTVDRS